MQYVIFFYQLYCYFFRLHRIDICYDGIIRQ